MAAERVLDLLELRMVFDPRETSVREQGNTWSTRTQASDAPGREFPAATIYFTLIGDRIVLEGLIGDDEVEDDAMPY